MITLLPLLLLAPASKPAPKPAAYPRTYLASVAELPLRPGEAIQGFSFSLWGVEIRAVCRIPNGWKIRAGGNTTPDGELSGEGSQAPTWFKAKSPPQLRDLVLIRLKAPVQRADTRKDGKLVPATFKGIAVISTGDEGRRAPLGYRNLTLRAAARCPG